MTQPPFKKTRLTLDQYISQMTQSQNTQNSRKFAIPQNIPINLQGRRSRKNNMPRRMPRTFVYQIGSGTKEDVEEAKKYIDQVPNSEETEHINGYATTKFKNKFFIKELPADPEGLLAGVFAFCVDSAEKSTAQKANKPTHIGFTINSELLNTPIWTPMSPINENSIEAVLNFFLKVAQSKWAEGITLWGAPFSVEVTLTDKSRLKGRQIRGSAAATTTVINHPIHQQCLIRIVNNDNHCLFYALQATLVKKVRKWTGVQFYRYLHSEFGMRGRLREETEALMREVGAPLGQEDYDAIEWVPKVVELWNRLYTGKYVFKVFIFNANCTKPILKEGPNDYTESIILYHTMEDEEQGWGHFDGVQRIGNLFGQPYCLTCEKCYQRPAKHASTCKARCIRCSRIGPGFPCPKTTVFRKKCDKCDKTFYNQGCYDHHLSSKFCNHSKQCLKCGIIWNMEANTRKGRQGHVCNEFWCNKCNEWHSKDRGCYIQPYEVFDKPACLFMVFDFETTQHEDYGNGRRRHRPNFISVRMACSNCADNERWKNSPRDEEEKCVICGPSRTVTFSERAFTERKVDDQRVTAHPLEDFVKWLMEEMDHSHQIFAFSHFGGRFDMVFVYRMLWQMKYKPEMIKRGNKMYEMKVEKLKLYFRDSFNLIPSSLASLVPTFELDIPEKPYFPHLANIPDNYGIDIYPTEADYLANSMMPMKKKSFDGFFAQNKHIPFRLEEQLAHYCCNDTDILMAALIKFRSEFMDLSKRPADEYGNADREAFIEPHNGIDPLREAITITSGCDKIFRGNHLPFNLLAKVPEKSYNGATTQSKLAHKQMQWLEEERGIKIQSAYSEGGEKKVGRYSLDGWVEELKLGIEINGCVWHACKKCFPDDDEYIRPIGKTAGLKRQEDEERMAEIKLVVPNIEIFWECEIRQMLKRNPRMARKFKRYVDKGPINIRNCFYGGRTGPVRLHYEKKPGEKIFYYDVTSLYPWVNFMTEDQFIGYPVGHPKVHILNTAVNWTRAEDNPYKVALMKVRVVPPRQLDVPVLPMKIEGDPRLLFPLCASCAHENPFGGVNGAYKCTHDDFERGWVSECTSVELDEALREGYRVTELVRVLEYEKVSKDLFRGYMREFLGEKIHASGFDAKIKGNREAEEKFILECSERFGIKIDREKMKTNKGRRALVKLCLNSLWGRFSLRNGLMETKTIFTPAEYADLLDRKDIEVYPPFELAPGIIFLNYVKKEEYVEEHSSSNVTISAWTTSCARLALLKSMQKVARTPGCTLIYTDTDSLIFASPENQCPLDLGPHIGDFTDECPDHEILEVICGGSKQYGLKLQRKDDPTAPLEYVLKIRGITINNEVMHRDGLQYEKFKSMVPKYGRENVLEKIEIIYPNFLRPSIKDGMVFSRSMTKIYKPFVAKGIIDPATLIVRTPQIVCMHGHEMCMDTSKFM